MSHLFCVACVLYLLLPQSTPELRPGIDPSAVPESQAPDPKAGAPVESKPSIRVEEGRTLTGHAWALAFSPDGNKLAVAGLGGEERPGLTYWDIESGRRLWGFDNPETDGASCVSVSPDGTAVMAVFKDAPEPVLVDAKTGKRRPLPQEFSERAALRVSFSPRGDRLATLDRGRLELWSWPGLTPAGWVESSVTQFVFGPDGASLILARGSGMRRRVALRAVDSTTDSEKPAVREIAEARSARLDALAVHPRGSEVCWEESGVLIRWSVAERKALPPFTPAPSSSAAAFSPDGSWIAVASRSLDPEERCYRVWSVSDPRRSVTFGRGRGLRWAVAFQPRPVAEGSAGESSTRGASTEAPALLATGGEGGVTLWTIR